MSVNVPSALVVEQLVGRPRVANKQVEIAVVISVEPERAARGAPVGGYPYVPGNFGEAPIGGAVEEMVRSVADDEEVRHFVVIVIANGATQRLLGLFQPPVDRRRKRKPARSIQANRGTGLDSGHATRKNSGRPSWSEPAKAAPPKIGDAAGAALTGG